MSFFYKNRKLEKNKTYLVYKKNIAIINKAVVIHHWQYLHGKGTSMYSSYCQRHSQGAFCVL